ncbi:hypothetical protein NK918_24780, partial [Salmonella enterica subsp. enterica serovar Typhimurium]|uniref:hypothetical protein n=1 Tax=Salmonella enterica TaxID=28901 RepID=UPI0020A5C997
RDQWIRITPKHLNTHPLSFTNMKIYRNTILLFALLQSFFNVLSAQTPTQTVRGMVIDKVSQAPLPGAVVLLLNTQPAVGVST